MKKILLFLIIPLAAVVVFSLLNLVDFYNVIDKKLYDFLLHIKPSVPENKNIVLLLADDEAIAKIGMWPWSRDIMADGLILMREFDVGYAVFDIEYVNRSPTGVNANLLEDEIPGIFSNEFLGIEQNVEALVNSIESGYIPVSEAGDYVEQLKELISQSKSNLLASVNNISRNNDQYMGQCMRFFGNSFLTVNVNPEILEEVTDEDRKYVLDNIVLKKVTSYIDFPHKSVEIIPTIRSILSGAKGAGFPRVQIDSDGVQRRVDLLYEYKGKFLSQLAFAPVLDLMGNPELEIYGDRLVLKQAKVPYSEQEEMRDIVIPLAEDKRMLINYPNKSFDDSFKNLSFYQLVEHQNQERLLVHNLRVIEANNLLQFYEGGEDLLNIYDYAENIKKDILAGDDVSQTEDYKEVRAYFFSQVQGLLSGETEKTIMDGIDRILVSPDVTQAIKDDYKQRKTRIQELFKQTGSIYENIRKIRNNLQQILPGSICFLGWSGTSTTDIGVTPFAEEYMNVGLHACVANTIITGRFLDDSPWWLSSIIALLLSVGVFFVIRRLKQPLFSIIVGLSITLAVFVLGSVFFIFTGIYITLLTPILAVFATFLILTFINFLSTAKEKTYIRNAFSHYLSTDVINELLLDPKKLELGGDEKVLSAIFTDIRGFSTIAEQLDPTALVKLLNHYLTEMSNIILDQRGTIDKYEGDAIISFFGAPVEFPDHARRACLAAVRMKKMEKIISEHAVREKLSPSPINTRIGVNTGKMVVGNMGTAKKMDYTIMGNSVNLAARLEGVNKQYNTWILITDSTYQAGGADFTVRKLDRVRVVGIKTPVRIYELIDEKATTSSQVKEAVDIFHSGLDLFENRGWAKAETQFKQVLKIIPQDGPANFFINRCTKYKKTPPSDSWDGVFNLTKK